MAQRIVDFRQHLGRITSLEQLRLVEGFGPKLSKLARDEVLMREKQMAKGQLVPFSAGKQAVRDNAGAVRIPAGTSLTDAQILEMNWLAEGVIGALPR